jgi:hypothetical protein
MMTNKSIRLPPKTGKELMDIIALRCDFHLQNLRNAVKYGAERRYKTWEIIQQYKCDNREFL